MRNPLSIGRKAGKVVRMDTLARYVVHRREALGMTQTELALRSGIAPTTLNKIEKGTTKVPPADTRRRLAAALSVRHVDILVAAGELTDDEIAAIAPRWPSDDERRVDRKSVV